MEAPAAAIEAGRPAAADGPVARAVARAGNRPADRTAPDRHAVGRAGLGRPRAKVPGPGAATAPAGPTVTGEGTVRPSKDRMTGRGPTLDVASGSVARPDRRVARQVAHPAAMVRGPGTARGIATDRVRRTPTAPGAGNDRTTGAGRVRAATTGTGPRAPACRPARAIGTAIVTKARPPGHPATRAARAGRIGRPSADHRARRSAPGPPASPGAIAAVAPARARIDDRGSRGPRPTGALARRFPKPTWSTTTRS